MSLLLMILVIDKHEGSHWFHFLNFHSSENQTEISYDDNTENKT